MTAFLYCGPFSARNEQGSILYENVEISLKEKSLTLLTGPSGCGKTTLLKQIVALSPAHNVRYYLQGKLYSLKELTLWRSRVTLVAQDAPLLMGNIKHNLTFPFKLKIAEDKKFDENKALTLLQEVGLGHIDWKREANTLSGGERHRLSLVRALLWDPEVLIFDEPLSGLDQKTAEMCFQLITKQARRPGRAVLCVLHDHNLFYQADEVLCMNNKTLKK